MSKLVRDTPVFFFTVNLKHLDLQKCHRVGRFMTAVVHESTFWVY